MVKMTDERIESLQCEFCGSRQKKKIDIFGNSGKRTGYSILCCNCGHIDSFALTSSAVDVFVTGNTNKVSETKIKCGLSLKEVVFCNDLSCKFRPVPPEDGPCKKQDNPPIKPKEDLDQLKTVYG